MKGVRGIVRRGGPHGGILAADIGIDESSGRTQRSTTDPGFERVEARLTLEVIHDAGHLTDAQAEILGKVIDGIELEENEYKTLAAAIREHPELMELLEDSDD